MKIRVLESCAGPYYDFAVGVHEVSERIGYELCNSGLAEPIREEVPEVAEVEAAPEVAVTRRARGRPRGSRNRPKPDAE
jgi:hypothetical protein